MTIALALKWKRPKARRSQCQRIQIGDRTDQVNSKSSFTLMPSLSQTSRKMLSTEGQSGCKGKC